MSLATFLPALNAVLNATTGVLLGLGFLAIRGKQPERHRKLMLAAFATSSAFLLSYAIRFALTGTHRYPGSGLDKAIYLAILGSHTVLAIVALPLILRSLQLALLKRQFDGHKKLARWALPVWMYVSVTGVVVYLMLYQLAPALQ